MCSLIDPYALHDARAAPLAMPEGFSWKLRAEFPHAYILCPCYEDAGFLHAAAGVA
jgi:hypothetical protein